MTYVLYIKELYDILRESATHCKMPKSGLKIRRSQGRGGSTPPPGTNYLLYKPLISTGLRHLQLDDVEDEVLVCGSKSGTARIVFIVKGLEATSPFLASGKCVPFLLITLEYGMRRG